MKKHNNIDLVEFRASNTKDRNKLTQFYNTVFSWQYKDWGDEYSDTQGSGLTSGIDVEVGSKNRTLTVIYSEDIDQSKKDIIAAGGTIIRDTYSFPGGRRFHFTDPVGNELAVWSE